MLVRWALQYLAGTGMAWRVEHPEQTVAVDEVAAADTVGAGTAGIAAVAAAEGGKKNLLNQLIPQQE